MEVEHAGYAPVTIALPIPVPFSKGIGKVESVPQLLERCRQMIRDRAGRLITVDAFPNALERMAPDLRDAASRGRSALWRDDAGRPPAEYGDGSRALGMTVRQPGRTRRDAARLGSPQAERDVGRCPAAYAARGHDGGARDGG